MVNRLQKPDWFKLQWHITERCNWHCKHCYQLDNHIKDELTTKQLFDVLDQYLFLIRKWNISGDCARIDVTGGEPLVRKDFFELAEKLGAYSDLFSWGLLTNGSFLTKDIVKKLKKFNLSRCQVSLEGLQENNDEIRGKGTFKKIINSIKLLADADLDEVAVSLTVTKKNIKDIPALVGLLDKLGVNRFSTKRLIPYGRGSDLKSGMLEPEELRKYYVYVEETNKKLREKNSELYLATGCESAIFNDERPDEAPKNYCGLIKGNVLTVMPNGKVLSCRRLPIVIGNVLKQSLYQIYYLSNKLWEIGNLNNAHPFCKECSNFSQCFGGAKCVTYCYTGKLFIPDVQCWKFYKKLEKPKRILFD